VIALAHGRSHLFSNAGGQVKDSVRKWRLGAALPSLVGALAPAVAVLGLVGLGVPRRLIVLAGAVVAAGYGLLGVAPGLADDLGIRWWLWPSLGVLALGVAATAALRLTRIIGAGAASAGRCRFRRSDWFLALWLGLEVASYFALSTFPAARRVMGIVVVMTALNGRLASRACRGSARAALLPGLVVGGMALGGLYYWVDLREAVSQKEVAEEAARWIRKRAPGATVWYVGHWGFQFYAERAGWRPVVPDHSRLRAGDWLVIPDENVDQQFIHLAVGQANPAHTIARRHLLGYRTLPWRYYAGSTPIHGDRKLRFSVRIYGAARDFIPAWSPGLSRSKPNWGPTTHRGSCGRIAVLVVYSQDWAGDIRATLATGAGGRSDLPECGERPAAGPRRRRSGGHADPADRRRVVRRCDAGRGRAARVGRC
jgi:hypothetical protein